MAYESVTAALGPCEYVQIFIGEKHDRNFVFLGGIAQNTGVSTIKLAT
jgi:hypothetical protein